VRKRGGLLTTSISAQPVSEFVNDPCPLLPEVERVYTAADSRSTGADRGEDFYRMRLRYAQSKWRTGYPAQAILQLNRAFSADLEASAPCLHEPLGGLPYPAMRWILDQRPDQRDQFLGNPRRHWQHYASRMSGPRAELRAWRSWACWAIACEVLPEEQFPGDSRQIEKEGLVPPTLEAIRAGLTRGGHPNEAALWLSVLQQS